MTTITNGQEPAPAVRNGPYQRLRLDELDSLRAFAAVGVVLVHYGQHFRVQPLPAFFTPLAHGGLFFVDFFFVLSGFVLCRAFWTETRQRRLLGNIWERIARLYPLHLLSLVAVAALQWYLVEVLNAKPFAHYLNDQYHFVLNALLLNASGLQRGFSFNVPAWSISTEFLVNLLFLAIILLPRRAATIVIGVVLVVSLVLLIQGKHVLADGGRPVVPRWTLLGSLDGAVVRTALGFFVGVLLYRINPFARLTEERVGSYWADALFMTAIVIAAVYMLSPMLQGVWYLDFVLVIFVFPAMVMAAPASRTVRSVLSWKPLVTLGQASYAIYLVHFPLQIGFHAVSVRTGVSIPYDQGWFLVAFLTTVMLLAIAIYRWIELPAKHALRRMGRSGLTPSAMDPVGAGAASQRIHNAEAALLPDQPVASGATGSTHESHRTHRSRRRSGNKARYIFGIFSAMSVVLIGALAVAHPYPVLASMLAIAFALVLAWREQAWVWLLPALLPLASAAPWTGSVVFDEFDILIATAIAVGYARIALRYEPPKRAGYRWWAAGILLVLAFLPGMVSGLASAVPQWPVVHDYRSAWNVLRMTKPAIAVVFLLPLLRRAMDRETGAGLQSLCSGIAAGLGLAAFVVVWERWAFPGLLDLGSGDYRVIGSFFEMHVGGATLDGYLAAALPPALALTLLAGGPARAIAWGLVLVGGMYAAVGTLSRTLYAVLMVALMPWGAVMVWRSSRFGTDGQQHRSWLAAIGGGVALVVLAGLFLRTYLLTGYRGVGAVAALLVAAVALPAGRASAGLDLRGALSAGAGVVLAVGLALIHGKLAYFAFGAALTLSLASSLLGSGERYCLLARLGFVWALCAALPSFAQARDWERAVAASPVLIVIILIAIWRSWQPAGSDRAADYRRVTVATLVAVALGVAAAGLGGYKFGERMEGTERDLSTRMRYWKHGLSFLERERDWAFGIGWGGYSRTFQAKAPDGKAPGTIEFGRDTTGPFVHVRSSTRAFGEPFFLTQRTGVAIADALVVSLEVDPVSKPLAVNVASCTMYVLYSENCAMGIAKLVPGQTHVYVGLRSLKDSGAMDGDVRPTAFALFILQPDRELRVRRISAVAATGRELLRNDNFAQAGAHWFFTSNHNHFPWHVESQWLTYLIEGGLIAALTLGFLTLWAMARLLGSLLADRDERTAWWTGALLASIVGFVGVGILNTVVDAPRVHFLFLLLVVTSAATRRVPIGRGRGGEDARREMPRTAETPPVLPT